MSRHATPRHATPRHATPRHATPRHATPRHATPRHATPRHATPRHATLRYAMLHYATLCYAMLCHVMLLTAEAAEEGTPRQNIRVFTVAPRPGISWFGSTIPIIVATPHCKMERFTDATTMMLGDVLIEYYYVMCVDNY